MARKSALSKAKNFKITQRLHKNFSNLKIVRELGHDYRTIKKFAINPAHCNEPSDVGKIRKQAPVSHRAMHESYHDRSPS